MILMFDENKEVDYFVKSICFFVLTKKENLLFRCSVQPFWAVSRIKNKLRLTDPDSWVKYISKDYNMTCLASSRKHEFHELLSMV